MFENFRKRLHTAMLIREAVDNYPDGICFAAPGGRPILSNKRINDVCYRLTGHTVTNADRMWEELQNRRIRGIVTDIGTDRILCRLQNGRVWQFQRRGLMLESGPVTQYEAADVSELYRYQKELREKNEQLTAMLGRQRILLQNIVENNLKKELLHTKMRIHSEFGKLLVMTENRLTSEDRITSEDGREGGNDIFRAWDNVITDMENVSAREQTVIVSPQNEILKMAAMIGCRVEFTGEEPVERRALLLLYAAVREALTNAVRHAGADRLFVEIRHLPGVCEVRISGNGKTDVTSIREGGGLGDLRRRLEEEGGTLRMEISEGVVMHATIPEGDSGITAMNSPEPNNSQEGKNG